MHYLLKTVRGNPPLDGGAMSVIQNQKYLNPGQNELLLQSDGNLKITENPKNIKSSLCMTCSRKYKNIISIIVPQGIGACQLFVVVVVIYFYLLSSCSCF